MLIGRRLLPAVAVAAAVTATAAPASAAPILGAATAYPVGASTAIAIADLNGDGVRDLITTDTGAGAVDVLIGRSDGTFLPAQAYPAGVSGTELTVLDVDGDGHQDVVVTQSATSYAVLRGDGTGGFGAPSGQTAANAITDPISGDFDLDGLPDVVGVASVGSGFTVLRNVGGSAFSSTQFVTSAIVSALGPAAAVDLDGDGDLDLVATAPTSNALVSFPNLGGGNFAYGQTLATGSSPVAAATGDLDGDGDPDVVVADLVSSTLSVLRGGTGSTLQPATSYAAGSAPQSVALGALDPGLDAVVADSQGLTVLPGRADGTFGTPVSYAGTMRWSVAAADFDGDGAADVAAVGSNGVEVRLSVPALDADATALVFGSATTGTDGGTRTVTVTNGGGAPLTLSGVHLAGADASDFAVTANTCTGPVPAGASCAVTVRFAPRGTAGLRAATLELAGNAGTSRSIALSGTATDPVTPPTTSTETTTSPAAPPAAAAPQPAAPAAPAPRPKPLVLGATTSFSGKGGLHGRSCPLHVAATARVNLGAAATVSLTAKARGATVARATLSLPAGRSALTLCLTQAGRRMAHKHTPLKATATLRVSASGFASATLTLPLRFTSRIR